MEKIDELLYKLDAKLELLEIEDNIIKKAEKTIVITKQSLQELRKFVIVNDFKDKSQEIDFFKNTKPKVYSKLIYSIKLFIIESKRPRGSNKYQVKYLNNNIEQLQIYFN